MSDLQHNVFARFGSDSYTDKLRPRLRAYKGVTHAEAAAHFIEECQHCGIVDEYRTYTVETLIEGTKTWFKHEVKLVIEAKVKSLR